MCTTYSPYRMCTVVAFYIWYPLCERLCCPSKCCTQVKHPRQFTLRCQMCTVTIAHLMTLSNIGGGSSNVDVLVSLTTTEVDDQQHLALRSMPRKSSR